MCRILFSGESVDYSGPWESVEAARVWAKAITEELNLAIS